MKRFDEYQEGNTTYAKDLSILIPARNEGVKGV